jgi:hypothetical protein
VNALPQQHTGENPYKPSELSEPDDALARRKARPPRILRRHRSQGGEWWPPREIRSAHMSSIAAELSQTQTP